MNSPARYNPIGLRWRAPRSPSSVPRAPVAAELLNIVRLMPHPRGVDPDLSRPNFLVMPFLVMP